jgi:hypothetical protein
MEWGRKLPHFFMEKPTGEFFSTLGQYVYQYINRDTLVPYYTGKGNGDRCWAHVIDKEFNPEDCFIVARNLERFEDKKDWQSFLLESYLISTHNPENNSVSGHYKECFVMASLSSMLAEFESEQYDNFSALPDWFIDNYDVFRGRVRELKLSAASTFVLSNSYNQMYMMFYWNPIDDEEPIKVTFEINLQEKHPKLEERKNITIKWLSKQGYKNPTQDGKVQKIAVNVNNIDDVITLWNEFWS